MDELRLEELGEVDGPDVYRARVFGDSMPELKAAALDKALRFYGPKAQLQVLGVRDVASRALADGEGHTTATVYVRCLNLPEEDRA